MLYRAHSFYSHAAVLINGRKMPFGINKQVQPLQCDKEMILAGTFLQYIIRGDRINKPALVRRKRGDVTSFLDIILLYSPQNLCKTPELWRLEAAWLCLCMWTVLLRVCSGTLQSDKYAKSLWGIIWKETLAPGSACQRLAFRNALSCKLSHSSKFF